ncbi:MAG: hypothetical protein V4524_00990 [Patescibacteria group bacterium]
MFFNTLHSTLAESNPAYASWHKHPLHAITHWSAFFALSLIVAAGLLQQISITIAESGVISTSSAQALSALRANRTTYIDPNQQQILFIWKSGVSKATQTQVLKREGITLVQGTNPLGVNVGLITDSDTPEEAVQRLSDIESAYVSAAMVDYIGVKSR